MVALIVLGIIALAIAIVLILNYINYTDLKRNFKRCNVIVYGKKGTGKDLIFQAVIRARKEPYYSNISYGYKLEEITQVKDISIMPNDYKRFIDNNLQKVELHHKENIDIYLSDCGVYLPSTYDTTLAKTFASFPPYYALSRHLTHSNIHCNTQALSRVWKQLREQADYYIRCRKTINLPFVLVTLYTTYDKYSSAESELRPLTKEAKNEMSKANWDLWRAQNGEVKNRFIIQLKRNIKYDTRAFKTLLVKE